MFTTLKLKQFLKHALGTKWELKSLARHQLKTKIPQELNEQLKLKPGTKSSASGTKLRTLVQDAEKNETKMAAARPLQPSVRNFLFWQEPD